MNTASTALVATFASAMFLKTWVTYSYVLAAVPSGIPSSARQSMFMVPPPPGMMPTPTSTRPAYVSAAAWTWFAPKHSSRPPPSVMPYGAATTGTRAYFIRCTPKWSPLMMSRIWSHCCWLAAMTMSRRLAPTQK